MTDQGTGFGDYVRRVRELTHKYVKELLSENEDLLVLVQSLNAEKLRLEAEAATLRADLSRQLEAHSAVVSQLSTIEAANHEATALYADIEQMNANLANLYVASYRIHASLEREDVLATVQEIIINLVGSEEFAIFERADDGSSLRIAASFGIDAASAARLDTKCPMIESAVQSGVVQLGVGADAVHLGGPTACIPLVVGGEVSGVIAIYRLLSHKPELESLDHELFTLLSTHAGTALFASRLHASAVGATR